MFEIYFYADQKENPHLHIQLTVNLNLLDKIITCQSFHEDNIEHVRPHSNVFELVQNCILLLT
jgi:hypothetical protein